jgi:glycosyltransferase involved in cell wall biosynthesis
VDQVKIGVLVVAYEASATLEAVLARIPPDFRDRITTILVCDDASTDDTYQVGMRVKASRPDLPLEVIRRPVNLGPILAGDADVVFGSRMLERGAALRGGMPKYKYVGNKILTFMQNRLAGVALSEWHSGYRAYSVAALSGVGFELNSDYYDFDTQIILQMIATSQRIVEIPIPTFYGDELSRVNGIRYGWRILKHTLRWRRSS